MPAWVLSLSRYKNTPLPHEHLVPSPIKPPHLSALGTFCNFPNTAIMTITIAQDAELMTNLVSAVAVPASRRFFAFTDEEKNPAVLSHSSKNTLDVVINVDGKPQLKDLGAIWNLPGDVQACCLMQDTDMQLSIAVATLVEPDKSRFYLIYGVMPADLLTYSSSKVAEGNDLFPTIHDIFMV